MPEANLKHACYARKQCDGTSFLQLDWVTQDTPSTLIGACSFFQQVLRNARKMWASPGLKAGRVAAVLQESLEQPA